MGKHERESIKQAEQIIIKILSAKGLSDFDKNNHWINHAIAIAKNIGKDFNDIKYVKHLGDRYDNTGDIMINSTDGKHFIEIKMSDSKFGIGTKANLSQDALTYNKLFENKTIHWSEFRKINEHDKHIINYLNKFKNYPTKVRAVTSYPNAIESKARYLRNIKKRNTFAKKILNDISLYAKNEKLEYLNYLSSQKQNNERIKKFLIFIILGIHKKEILKELLNHNIIFNELQDLITYYTNVLDGRIEVKRDNSGEKIKKILNNYGVFKISFPKNMTYCEVIGSNENSDKSLLKMVFHWKNIAQGIKTPCLNIFE